MCPVLEEWKTQFGMDFRSPENVDLSPLGGARELALLQRLGEYAEMLENAATELAPHQVVFYLRELAGEFHIYYNAEPILVPEPPPRSAPLALSPTLPHALPHPPSSPAPTPPQN